jgi:hypothetical protein
VKLKRLCRRGMTMWPRLAQDLINVASVEMDAIGIRFELTKPDSCRIVGDTEVSPKSAPLVLALLCSDQSEIAPQE